MDIAQLRRTSVYNGVSDRARGWKTKKTEKPINPSSLHPGIKRWNGASRSQEAWDCLRKDPELWFKDGDCYVHLYAEGQSRRGPAFKVSFATLLEANCHPLIERFISSTFSALSGEENEDGDGKAAGRYELYIPAPPHSDKDQSFHYHLATRNFFAFVFGRSMVGESLGGSLIALMNSMHEFRSPEADNDEDLMNYMDEEGYLDLNGQTTHALAMLRLAEVFRMRSLYINAFAHCCGMNNRLFMDPEYQLLFSGTRTLIRRSRIEMDGSLGQCGSMLRTFLQDAMSEVDLKLSSGARAHIERFRTLLHGLYAARFGYYPPRPTKSEHATFEIAALRTMRDDFEALYKYLVDESFNITQDKPFFTQDGICTLANIAAFDSRFQYDTLFHPLPLLPEMETEVPKPRRLSWVRKSVDANKSQNQTLITLLQATNSDRPGVLKNPLVRAYRKFEEDSVRSPIKADKMENLGPVDGRKVRWILIYAVYQTLLQATAAPREVEDDDTPYHLCISTANLPPWKEQRPVHTLARDSFDQTTQSPSTPALTRSSRSSSPSNSSSAMIQPDIDYRALMNQTAQSKELESKISQEAPNSRSNLTSSTGLTRSLPVRRAFSLFVPKPGPEKCPAGISRPATYQEIVVDGYGNGMNNAIESRPKTESKVGKMELPAIHITPFMTVDAPAGEELLSSVASVSSYSHSESGSSDSSNTSVGDSPIDSISDEWEATGRCETVSPLKAGRPTDSQRQRPVSTQYSLTPAPLNISKSAASRLQMPAPKAQVALEYIKAVVEAETILLEEEDEWRQFGNLGGLVEVRPSLASNPRRASLP